MFFLNPNVSNTHTPIGQKLDNFVDNNPVVQIVYKVHVCDCQRVLLVVIFNAKLDFF